MPTTQCKLHTCRENTTSVTGVVRIPVPIDAKKTSTQRASCAARIQDEQWCKLTWDLPYNCSTVVARRHVGIRVHMYVGQTCVLWIWCGGKRGKSEVKFHCGDYLAIWSICVIKPDTPHFVVSTKWTLTRVIVLRLVRLCNLRMKREDLDSLVHCQLLQTGHAAGQRTSQGSVLNKYNYKRGVHLPWHQGWPLPQQAVIRSFSMLQFKESAKSAYNRMMYRSLIVTCT